MTSPIVLYYGHDPMCSFCWAFRPCWESVKKELALASPDIKVIYLLGGLAPDSDQAMPEAMRNKLIQTWRYIEKNIPATEFNFDFWTEQQARRSTYPACRAVYAAKSLAPLKEDDMILAIQQAYYLNAQNPSDDNTLIRCATSIGLDQQQFRKAYLSDTCENGFKEQREFAHAMGIVSFPSLVLSKRDSRFSIPIDYKHSTPILNSIEAVLAHL